MRQAYCLEADFDPVTGQCAAVLWETPTGFLPPLSVSDALALSAGFAGLMALAWSLKLVRKMVWK